MQCCHLCCAGAPSSSDPLDAQQLTDRLLKGKAFAYEVRAPDKAAAANGGPCAVANPTGPAGGPSKLGSDMDQLEEVAGTAKVDAAGQ